MSLNWTPIQWTWAQNPDGSLVPMSGSTWNPLLGCKEVSPGCRNCYAARLIGTRFSKNPSLPMHHDIATTAANGHPHFTGERRAIEDRMRDPLTARKGRKVFVNDMGDLFFEGHPFEDIARVFAVMALAQQHTFQCLTKRPERAAEFLAKWAAGGRHIWTAAQGIAMPRGKNKPAPGWPLPNVWIGTSVEDRASKARIDALRSVPASVRFLSIEPLLEDPGEFDLTGIHWIIVGGESGPKARPFDLAWARSLRDQARAAGVAFFMKQLGSSPQQTHVEAERFGSLHNVQDSHGGNPAEWPADLRVREFPRT